jgi:beta-lactamase class A
MIFSMASTLRRQLLTLPLHALGSPPSHATSLTSAWAQWTINTQTGLKRLRAGLPKGWRAGDKTGTGWHPSMVDKINDVAIVWPPGRAPWVIAAFYETPAPRAEPMQDSEQAVLATVARIAVRG